MATKLDLGLASGSGLFTSYNWSKDSAGVWGRGTDDTTSVNAKFYADGTATAGTTDLGTVVANGSTYDLTKIGAGIKEVTAGGSTKKWNITTQGATSLEKLTGSDQNDLLTIVDGAGLTITTGLGKDSVDVTNLGTSATLADYTYGSDVIKIGNVATDIQDSITSAGVVTSNNNNLQLKATSGYYKATFVNTGSDAVHVWKGGSDASVLDGSAETEKLVMSTGDKADTLMGGTKADSLFALTDGAYVIGGAGNDTITLENVTKHTRQFVAFGATSGTDEVTNFDGGVAAGNAFADNDDVLVLQNGAIKDIKITAGTDTIIKSGSGSVSLKGVNSTGNIGLLMQESTGAVSKVEIVTAAGTTIVNAAAVADYYISAGKTGKVDFSTVDDNVVADLGNAGAYEDNMTFVGIDSVKGGKGNTTLVGAADAKNVLEAGAGNTTLWGGGASNDTLIGGAEADAFYVGQGDGKDSISTFTTGTGDTADTLYMLNSPVADIKKDASNTTFTFTDGSSVALASGAAADTVQFSLDGTTTQVAAIGTSNADNSLNYTGKENMFFGGSKTDTVTVGTSYEGNEVDIRLNNTGAVSFSSVEVVNASAYDGKAFLAGSDEGSEKLVGSTGKTTLWGGIGAVVDTLQGTAGDVTSFYFGKNNGEDIIAASDSDDKVVFYDFANTDLTAIDTTGSQLKFTFNDGSSLQVQAYTSESVQTFEFTNGTWTYDKSSNTFTQTK